MIATETAAERSRHRRTDLALTYGLPVALLVALAVFSAAPPAWPAVAMLLGSLAIVALRLTWRGPQLARGRGALPFTFAALVFLAPAFALWGFAVFLTCTQTLPRAGIQLPAVAMQLALLFGFTMVADMTTLRGTAADLAGAAP